MNNDAVLNNIQSIEDNYDEIFEIVSTIVGECCEKLDQYVNWVSEGLKDNSGSITDEELDDIIMTIPTLVYFAGEVQERIGLKGDMSETVKKQKFNEHFISVSGTVQAKKSQSELETVDDDITSYVYSRAYNIVKQKISNALELLQSAKKVASRRMLSLELSRSTPNYDKG